MAEITATLRNAVRNSEGPWRPYDHLSGDIYGDTRMRFVDGERVSTSRIISVHGDVFTTLNSIYRVESWEGQSPANDNLYSTLREANKARQDEWCAGTEAPDLSFRGNELAGEVGEACNVIKKLERERHGWRGSRDTVEHLAEELADVVICADLIALSAGIDLDAAVRAKFNATSEKQGFSHRMVPA